MYVYRWGGGLWGGWTGAIMTLSLGFFYVHVNTHAVRRGVTSFSHLRAESSMSTRSLHLFWLHDLLSPSALFLSLSSHHPSCPAPLSLRCFLNHFACLFLSLSHTSNLVLFTECSIFSLSLLFRSVLGVLNKNWLGRCAICWYGVIVNGTIHQFSLLFLSRLIPFILCVPAPFVWLCTTVEWLSAWLWMLTASQFCLTVTFWSFQ